MSKYVCKCGYIFILSTGNEDYDCRIIKNSKIEEIGGFLNNGNMNEEEFYNKIDSGALTVYICPECERVHISNPDLYSRFFSVYKKED
ncbi:hypothetical protein [Delftia sp. K82]|uniref:hypothetical protein n=1 Tax=Delftia sp. K82 TaxID=1472718 RepID=UPI001178098E|nr:hypothetical protein [Delftia sp. K82]